MKRHKHSPRVERWNAQHDNYDELCEYVLNDWVGVVANKR